MDFLVAVLCFAGGLFTGWVLLPAPKSVQDWWKGVNS